MKVRYPQLHDRDWLAARFTEGMTQTEIGRLLGCDQSSVSHAALNLGLRRKGPARERISRSVLKAMIDAGERRVDMAAALGVSLDTLQTDIAFHGLQTICPVRIAHTLTRERLTELFADPAVKTAEVARALDCSVPTVNHALARAGLSEWVQTRRREHRIATRAEQERQRKIEAARQREEATETQRAWLEEQFAAGRSLRQIAADIGYDYSSISIMAKRYGLKPSGSTSKLTDSDVKIIRRRLADGDTKVAVAADFGVSTWTIKEIAHRRTWKHVA